MSERVLGVEGGGTKTAWVLFDHTDGRLNILEQGRLPPANLRLTPPERLRAFFAELPQRIDRAGIFLAGCVTDADRRDLSTLCAAVWPNVKLITGSDRDSGMAAALQDRDGIAVNAGTGSSVTGRRARQIEKAGGWGHILGDVGGGYYLSIQALRLVLEEYDLHRGAAELAADILHALALNNFDELVRWAQSADKMEVATLAPVVFRAAENGDARVRELLANGAVLLAEYTSAVARRLGMTAPEVRLLGGLFRCCEIYTGFFRDELRKLLPQSEPKLAEHSPEFGAAWLALQAHLPLPREDADVSQPQRVLAAAATEQRNLRSEELDRLNARDLVSLFVEEERFVEEAVRACADELAKAIEIVAAALGKGGRLFYVGAGTSGRLGVLDASEIPPTFGASPLLVQGIIAGGATALYRSVEGAEDEPRAGALAIAERNAHSGDVVLGISASGRTPFVTGALEAAKRIGTRTILLTCNPIAGRNVAAELQIDLPTGAELITGSTRLKAGTATKVALNIISSCAMIALGKVRGNLMIDVSVSNVKLRDRAARIVAQLAECSYEEATSRLAAADWNLRRAIES
ncbi:MAG: N-acetylmuramic acid 6-phosphate etherase [Chthoniobacterales bacterium]